MRRHVVRAVAVVLGSAVTWAVVLLAQQSGAQSLTLPAIAITLLAATLSAGILARLTLPPGTVRATSLPLRRNAPAPSRVHDPDRPGSVRPRAPGDCRS